MTRSAQQFVRHMLNLSVAEIEAERSQSRTLYWAEGERVCMAGVGGPVYLDHAQADQLLGIYHEAGAARDFNALHDALVEAGGVGWR